MLDAPYVTRWFLFAVTYRLMNSASVQGLHSTLGRARIVVLDESVVEALGL